MEVWSQRPVILKVEDIAKCSHRDFTTRSRTFRRTNVVCFCPYQAYKLHKDHLLNDSKSYRRLFKSARVDNKNLFYKDLRKIGD